MSAASSFVDEAARDAVAGSTPKTKRRRRRSSGTLHFLTPKQRQERCKRLKLAKEKQSTTVNTAVSTVAIPSSRQGSQQPISEVIDLSSDDLLPLPPIPLSPPPSPPSSPLPLPLALHHSPPPSSPSPSSSSSSPSISPSSFTSPSVLPTSPASPPTPAVLSPLALGPRFAEADRKVAEAHHLLSSLQPLIAEAEESRRTAATHRQLEAAVADAQRQLAVERGEKEKAQRAAAVEVKLREEAERRHQAAVRRVQEGCEQLSAENAELRIERERRAREAEELRRLLEMKQARLDWYEAQERRVKAQQVTSMLGKGTTQ